MKKLKEWFKIYEWPIVVTLLAASMFLMLYSILACPK